MTSTAATVKLFIDGVENKNIPQVLINFNHTTIEAFHKHVMTLCRLHPKEPLYDCVSITISEKVVDIPCLKTVLSIITKGILAGKKASKIKLVVFGKLKVVMPRKTATPSFRAPIHPLKSKSLSAIESMDGSPEDDDSSCNDQDTIEDMPRNRFESTSENAMCKVGSVDDSGMYGGGYTAGEALARFSENLRSPDRSSRSTSAQRREERSRSASRSGKDGVAVSAGGVGSATKSRTAVSRIRGGGGGDSLWGDGDDKDRLSMATIRSQWEFMRSNFVNNSEEELEWLMVSKRTGAFKHAHKKSEAAEDRYYKALSDINMFGYQHSRLVEAAAVICPLLGAMVEGHVVLSTDGTDRVALDKVAAAQSAIAIYLKDDAERESKKSVKWALKVPIMKSLLGLSGNPLRCGAARSASHMVSKNIIPLELKESRMMVVTATKTSDDSLIAMEKWSKREKETEEYSQVLSEEEAAWMTKESVANRAALLLMQSYMPSSVCEMSVKDLCAAVREKGGLITQELATELKTNRLLQWVTMHPADIAMENFLNGEKKQFFLNLERLDAVELRALASIMPLKFELDGEGKKAEWRERFMTRAKQVIAQQCGDFVKGGWDDVKGCRATVKLRKLNSDLERRPVYFYPSCDQCTAKLVQYDTRASLLLKKRAALEKATADAISCKSEYDTLLREMRDPEVKAFFGTDKVTAAKDSAKQEWSTAESLRKSLTTDTARLIKTIADSPMTREQFADSIENIRMHLMNKGVQWAEQDSEPVTDSSSSSSSSSLPQSSTPKPSEPTLCIIEGVFDPPEEVFRIVRQSAKFVTAEEEAESRRLELTALSKKCPLDSSIGPALVEDIVTDPDTTEREGEEEGEVFRLHLISEPIDGGERLVGLAASLSCVNSSFSSVSAEQPIQSEEWLQKKNTNTPSESTSRNVLSSVDPDLIARLNKMFSPMKTSPHSTSQPSSRSTPSVSRCEVVDTPGQYNIVDVSVCSNGLSAEEVSTARGNAEVPPSPPVKFLPPPSSAPSTPFKGTQSKLLQRLQSLKEDQEKSERDSAAQSASADGDTNSIPPPRPPTIPLKMSFLDQIKSRKPAGGGMSFLDQIKARAVSSE